MKIKLHTLTLILALPCMALGETVVAWGDSLTGGNSWAWPAQFALLSGNKVLVRGVGGQTSTQIKDRFLAEPGHFGDPVIIWAGRNNFGDSATVLADIATMVAELTTDKYLILGVINGNYPGEFAGAKNHVKMLELNSELAKTYGDKFLDIRKVLVDAYDPTSEQDVSDHKNDIVPTSLRGTDPIHINPAGHQLVANAVNEAFARQNPQ